MFNTDEQLQFCIPSNVNVRQLLVDAGKNVRYINCNIDKYHWFFNALFVRSTLNKKYQQGDYIPMNTELMVSVLGARYVADIKKLLSDAGIIETNEVLTTEGGKHNLRGRESIGYRLTEAYQVRHVKVLEDSDSTFIQNLKQGPSNAIKNMDFVTRTSTYHLNDLGIYKDDADAYIESWYAQNLAVENPLLKKELDKDNRKRTKEANRLKKAGKPTTLKTKTYKEMLEDKRQAYLQQVDAIYRKAWLPMRDNKGRRLHTFISNMWKGLRQFLYYKPNPSLQLVGLDCSNSQPFTLVKIILDYFEGIDEMPADAEHYIHLVSSGELYKYLWLEMGRCIAEAEFQAFKTDLFALVFYSSNQSGYFSREAETFRQRFPTVYQIIMSEKKYQYQQLSVEMQRVETEAVLDGALTYLFQKHPDTFFASIHDSVLCPDFMQEEVREVMLAYYTKVVGVTPHIKPAENINTLKNDNQGDELRRLYVAWFSSILKDELMANAA
ncbi:hypothetical protein ABID22_000118 [Pontibacter aydingkolensis]|uniref:Uncharacterized protein n=1 Tax=Pontibacter aydingkolensis TaxID=1911536 RepID=A0ABS7CQW5_9BACT|nr:hypothetical protein [Pontibacter aydingkolensis]MBW7466214.1 hypothetical protein [Pontibacter aydingkolensis]